MRKEGGELSVEAVSEAGVVLDERGVAGGEIDDAADVSCKLDAGNDASDAKNTSVMGTSRQHWRLHAQNLLLLIYDMYSATNPCQTKT